MKYLVFITILFINYFFGFSQDQNPEKNHDNYLQIIQNLKNQEKNADNLLQLAEIYLQTGNYQQAIKKYQQVLLIQDDIETKLKLAKAYIGNNQRENAIKIYQKIIAEQPNNLLLKYRLANLYFKNKEFKKSTSLLLELQKKDSSNLNFAYKLALSYKNIKQYDNAISVFKEIINKDSSNYKSYYHLAKIYRIQKKKDSTDFYLKKGLQIKPYYVLLNQLNTKNAFGGKNYQEVIKSVKRLDLVKAMTPFYQNLLGIAYYQNKEYKKASETLNKLFLKRYFEGETLYYLGLTSQKLKNNKLAEIFFNMSINYKRPKIDKEYYQLAVLNQKQGQPKKAIAFYKLSLKEKSYNPNALYELAVLSENYYKDKSIALKLYQDYISHFESLDSKRTQFVLQQIQKIKTDLFFKK